MTTLQGWHAHAPTSITADPSAVEAFISRWSASGGSELSNAQMYLSELCDLIGVPRPEPAQANTAANDYVFERTYKYPQSGSTGRMDAYKRNCFVLESKQGIERRSAAADSLKASAAKLSGRSRGRTKLGVAARGTPGWASAMEAARNQALRGARYLSGDHALPPFALVVDVGYCIDVWSNFSGGAEYLHFPDSRSFRVFHDEPLHTGRPSLRDPVVRAQLARIWSAPELLNPARHSEQVTQEASDALAKVARSMESRDLHAESVSEFLLRCLFCMFAEDIGLLPHNCFTKLLESLVGRKHAFPAAIAAFWQDMDRGSPYSAFILDRMPRFNGKLFAQATALDISDDELDVLIAAAHKDWAHVEPSIFGTLLERALDERKRHALGAHYTPRAYVERLVQPTVMEPLRAAWRAANAAATKQAMDNKRDAAIATVRSFHHHLCTTRVLDPACGSGNFLYVTLELMKRLEGEVLQRLHELGAQAGLSLASETVDPSQFLGLEVNERAAKIAEMVLWIGYLQWQVRQPGTLQIAEPVLRDFGNVQNRDAILAWDERELVRDEHGRPVTHWDGVSYRFNASTRQLVPDETRRLPAYTYVNPRQAPWPSADFIVGNPPFVGTKRMLLALGNSYVAALRSTYPDVPDAADLVMYWWHRAASLAISGDVHRAGFITTNSITQNFNRRTVTQALARGARIIWAIADHPWTDGATAAAVRVAMTVVSPSTTIGSHPCVLGRVGALQAGVAALKITTVGEIHADLSSGARVVDARPLEANANLTGMGVALHGKGFLLDPSDAAAVALDGSSVIRRIIAGRDLTQVPRERYVIDFSFMSRQEATAANATAMERVVALVKPHRDANRRATIREKWWRFGWERPLLRQRLHSLERYILTTETAKHRFFTFVSGEILPDHSTIAFATDDAFVLGVLSSRAHTTWALAAGGRLGVGNDPRYNKKVCFDPFPFPDPTLASRSEIRSCADELDAHRKARQAAHPKLTLTHMYNVLQKLRDEVELTPKELQIKEDGQVAILRHLHDALDAAVFAAYGWDPALSDEDLLVAIVALNHERAAEEEAGQVRWLRPDLAPDAQARAVCLPAKGPRPKKGKASVVRKPWPKQLPARFGAVLGVLSAASGPLTLEQIAAHFSRAPRKSVNELLQSMAITHTVAELDGQGWVIG